MKSEDPKALLVTRMFARFPKFSVPVVLISDKFVEFIFQFLKHNWCIMTNTFVCIVWTVWIVFFS